MDLALSTDTAAHPSDNTRRRSVERPWYRFAARLLPTGGRTAGRWIDLGCGQGEFLALAAEHGLVGAGLDYWASNAKAAAHAGPTLVADLNGRLPFRDASLDGATLIEVIEHIIRAEDLLAELARVLRPGGWLVLTTPNVAHVTYRWRAVTGHPPKQEGYHYRFFTRRTLAEAVEHAGFRLVGRASFGKQSLLSKLGRLSGRGRKWKFRYAVPATLESLLAQHFVWRLERLAGRAPGEGAVGRVRDAHRAEADRHDDRECPEDRRSSGKTMPVAQRSQIHHAFAGR